MQPNWESKKAGESQRPRVDRYIGQWKPKEFKQWLQFNGLGQYVPKFARFTGKVNSTKIGLLTPVSKLSQSNCQRTAASVKQGLPFLGSTCRRDVVRFCYCGCFFECHRTRLPGMSAARNACMLVVVHRSAAVLVSLFCSVPAVA